MLLPLFLGAGGNWVPASTLFGLPDFHTHPRYLTGCVMLLKRRSEQAFPRFSVQHEQMAGHDV